MIPINIKPDLKPLQRAFINFHAKQAPFATALALTTLAKEVQAIEREDVIETFANPTPFTRNAFSVTPATKGNPIAVVFPKDIQAEYLAPFVEGGSGMQALGSKRAILLPRSVGLNQYGNIPRNKLASLRGRPDIFVGAVKLKRSGQRVSGVWQRSGPRASGVRKVKGVRQPQGSLKLLIKFSDALPVKEHLDFFDRADRYLRANAARAFNDAMVKALATAR